MRDMVVTALVVMAFAVLVTAHVTTCFGLARRAPRARALAAFFLPPLALYWAIRERMTARAIVWSVGAVAYGVGLAMALT